MSGEHVRTKSVVTRTDGYSIETVGIFDDHDLAHDVMLEDYNRLNKNDPKEDTDWLEMSKMEENSAILYDRGAYVYAWSIIPVEYPDFLQVNTTAGVISAYKSDLEGNPGIEVLYTPEGYDDQIDAARVTVYESDDFTSTDNEKPEDIVIHTFGDVYEEDFTKKYIIRRSDIEQACTLKMS